MLGLWGSHGLLFVMNMGIAVSLLIGTVSILCTLVISMHLLTTNV